MMWSWHDTAPWGAASGPENDPTVLRLLVEAKTGDAKQDVLAAVRRTIGEQWQVAPLFPEAADDPECEGLARFFSVTGRADTGHPSAIFAAEAGVRAWDLAYELRDAGPFESVQLDLPHSSYGEDTFYGVGFPETDHLPGSEPRDWALENIRGRQAWDILPPNGGAAKGQGVQIGHIDTGYTDHPQLGRAALDLVNDIDILDKDYDAQDPLIKWWPLDSPGHGTLTGSVIAGRTRDEMFSVAPMATIVPIRAIRSVVNVFDANVAQAVDYARRTGCHVVSMSLGGGFFRGLEEAVNCAVRKGVIVMAAAGNYSPPVVWPALYPNCIAVAASNADDAPWIYTSHGSKVAVSAPGESVWAAGFHLDRRPPAARVDRHSGTSFAVAHLAGAAALWLAHHGRSALLARFGKPRLQAAFLEVLRTAGHRRPAQWNAAEYGVGIVDAEALLRAPLPDPDGLQPAAVVVSRPDARELIHAVCPEVSTSDIALRLSGMLNAQGAELEAKLDRYGAELLYLISEHSDVRDAFVRGDTAEVVSPTTVSRAGPSMRAALVGRTSRSLRREMGLPQ